MSIHADDEFSLRIALDSELDDVLPSEGLAGRVIARHRKIRRRRVAGAVSLVVVCAGIGVPLGLSAPATRRRRTLRWRSITRPARSSLGSTSSSSHSSANLRLNSSSAWMDTATSLFFVVQ